MTGSSANSAADCRDGRIVLRTPGGEGSRRFDGLPKAGEFQGRGAVGKKLVGVATASEGLAATSVEAVAAATATGKPVAAATGCRQIRR
ncbi:hypothetical protein MLD38_000389 [Melastoma candidum]|uniref:Uncharacterized protein n=1 Tax=Melastoma candidum TaxID=119954 RepID=A0ACB9SII6_9MYRT|nr:hypothetical protein MLD38_000389 [Melastoma candidum]